MKIRRFLYGYCYQLSDDFENRDIATTAGYLRPLPFLIKAEIATFLKQYCFAVNANIIFKNVQDSSVTN